MIITIEDEEKSWLESYSHAHHQSMSETVRRAIESFRTKRIKEGRHEFLSAIAGIWRGKHGDGLDYVDRIRSEWEL
jgi:hypothetical protein